MLQSMSRRLPAVILGCAVCATAAAQSFNVDLDTTGGSSGFGVPAPTYGAGAGQPGVWNSIRSTNPVTSSLTGLNGAATAATFTRATNGSFENLNNALITSGNFESLVDDIFYNEVPEPMTFSFNNLQAGIYVVYTYAFNAEFPNQQTFVTVAGSFGQTQQACGGGPLDGNRAVPGKVYTAHGITVAANGSITIQVQPNNSWPVSVAGFQIKRLPDNTRNRIYVRASLNGDGGSWPDAMKQLQDALDVATRIGAGVCEIWTALGTYHPTTGTDRNASFVIPSGLELYGGFAGNENTLAERLFPAFFITNMSGSIGTASTADNSYHVVRISNATAATVIDGFSISQGTANGSSNDGNGGGLLILNASPVIRNTKFLSNRATIQGGGVSIQTGSPQFSYCLFYNNTVSNGSGGAVYRTGTGTARFGNCEFLDNEALGDGGALYALGGTTDFVNCLFNANKALSSFNADGGAIYAALSGVLVQLNNCTVANNTAGGTAGGLAVSTNASIVARNTILWANSDLSGNPMPQQQASTIAGSGFFNLDWAWIHGLDPNPQFVSLSGSDGIPGNFDDNLRLLPTSPCIDSANNTLLPNDLLDLNANNIIVETLPVDFDGKPRRIDLPSVPNTGVGSAPIVDFGAFEVQPQPCPADINNNGAIDSDDLGILLGAFGCTSACGPADINNSGAVDSDDLGILLSAFGDNC
ncbi:MAG: right-handed parallel beta-helix repeat-containing protein [Phycisphaerales bacterium]